MAKQQEQKQPVQIPGDAESPEKGHSDPEIKKAVQHSDKTEPVQAARKNSSRQEG